jgi:hypothetical protein
VFYVIKNIGFPKKNQRGRGGTNVRNAGPDSVAIMKNYGEEFNGSRVFARIQMYPPDPLLTGWRMDS